MKKREDQILTNRDLSPDPVEMLRLDVAIYDARFWKKVIAFRIDREDILIWEGADDMYFSCEQSGSVRTLPTKKLKTLVRVSPKILLNVLHELREMIAHETV